MAVLKALCSVVMALVAIGIIIGIISGIGILATVSCLIFVILAVSVGFYAAMAETDEGE